MLVAPNANGFVMTPPGALPSTFTQTSTVLGAYNKSRSLAPATWKKSTVPTDKVLARPNQIGSWGIQAYPKSAGTP